MYRSGGVSYSGQTYNAPIFTGVSQFADGASGAPSIAYSAANTTGWYRTTNGIFTQIAGVDQARLTTNFYVFPSTFSVAWSANATISGSADTSVSRAGANGVQFGAGGTGTTTARTEINKAISSITDAAATATFTVTIPNGAHSASILVILTGSLGAGGAIGANEASASIAYNVAVARTAGVNAVATISAAFGSAASAAVAGAATITVAGTLSAISGAVGATNTFTINVTITRGSGSSTNHTCFAYAKLLNANATGVTIA